MIYGIVKDQRVSKILIELEDGEKIINNVKDKDYYFIYRESIDISELNKIIVFDKEDNILYKHEPKVDKNKHKEIYSYH